QVGHVPHQLSVLESILEEVLKFIDCHNLVLMLLHVTQKRNANAVVRHSSPLLRATSNRMWGTPPTPSKPRFSGSLHVVIFQDKSRSIAYLKKLAHSLHRKEWRLNRIPS